MIVRYIYICRIRTADPLPSHAHHGVLETVSPPKMLGASQLFPIVPLGRGGGQMGHGKGSTQYPPAEKPFVHL